MSHMPGYTTRRGWQAIARWPGGSLIIGRGGHLRCAIAALFHRLRHPSHRVHLEPIS